MATTLAFILIIEVLYILPQIKEREVNLQQALYEERITPIAMMITGFQDEMRYKLEMLARMPEVRGMNSAQQELILSISSRSSWRFETVDMGIADSNGTIVSYKANDQSGVPLASVATLNNISELSCFTECMETNATCFSEPFLAGSAGPMIITIATPIYDMQDYLAGVVFAHASISSLVEAVRQFELDENENLLVVDSNGMVLAHSQADNPGSGGNILGLDYSVYEPVREAMEGNSGTLDYERDGDTYIAGYAAIAPADWGLILEKPLSAVIERGNVLPNFILATTLALFMCAAVLTVIGSWRILRPLGALVQYADEVSHGNYSADLNVSGNDEVASVAEAIKSMVGTIVRTKDEEVSTLIGSINEGLMMLDDSGRILRMNPALEEMLGIDSSQVLGKTFAELEQKDSFANLSRLNHAFLLGREAFIEYPRRQILQVRSSGIKRDGNNRSGEVRIVIDVTRQKELEQMQSDFIANTTHELRTPLHSIRGFVNLLLNGQVNDKDTQHEFLTIVNNESQHLNNLVDSILNISRIESGNVKYRVEPVQMEKVIGDVIVKMQNIAMEKNIALNVHIDEPLPSIDGDAEKLGQVMRNLLSNAIKFSHADSAVVVTASSNDQGLLVSVKDEGIGIAAENITQLFQKFSQIDSSMTRSQNGTGLGLYITRHFIEAHGGKAWVESEQGKGSVFYFTLRGMPVALTKR